MSKPTRDDLCSNGELLPCECCERIEPRRIREPSVWVLVTNHHHGDDVNVYASEDGALEGAAEFVSECLDIDIEKARKLVNSGDACDVCEHPDWDCRNSYEFWHEEVKD